MCSCDSGISQPMRQYVLAACVHFGRHVSLQVLSKGLCRSPLTVACFVQAVDRPRPGLCRYIGRACCMLASNLACPKSRQNPSQSLAVIRFNAQRHSKFDKQRLEEVKLERRDFTAARIPVAVRIGACRRNENVRPPTRFGRLYRATLNFCSITTSTGRR